jgi:hypothetical protein
LPFNALHNAVTVTLSHMKKWNNPKHNNALEKPKNPNKMAQAANTTE